MTANISTPLHGSGEAFYMVQASREQSAADAAVLNNVRHKHQLAANSWTSLARKAANSSKARDTRDRTTYLLGALAEPSENPDRIDR